MEAGKKQQQRESFHSNRIPITFNQAVEGLLAVKPKKTAKPKKKTAKK
jgi:hypothetical protein